MTLTLIIIAITVLTSIYAWKNEGILHKWIFNPYQIVENNEYHRFITSGFIHNDYTHLFFNMFTLYFFGTQIEQTYSALFGNDGFIYFILLYLASIIISDIPSFIKHRHNPNYNSLGASGGVAALVFSSIIFYPTANIWIFGIIPIPGFILGLLFIIYSYYEGKKARGRINHDAHLFGALFGILFTVVIEPRVINSFINQIGNFQIF